MQCRRRVRFAKEVSAAGMGFQGGKDIFSKRILASGGKILDQIFPL